MPKIFRQRDIDQMLPSDVSQDFVDYYNRLSDDRKREFTEKRPDLIAVVQKWKSLNPEPENVELPIIQESFTRNSTAKSVDLSKIMHNRYDGVSIPNLIKDDFRPIEALTIEDRRNRCPAHRVPLVKYNPRFHNEDGAILGMIFYHCPKCNRLFIKQSKYDINAEKLKKWKVPYTFYDLEISKQFLKTQTQPYTLKVGEKIYIPERWIEENPECPIHKCFLEELPCIIMFAKKKFAFDAYFCSECQKVVMRRIGALKVEDHCAKIGIPVKFDKLVLKVPPKIPVPKREIKPDYFMDNGQRKQYAFEHITNCYKLTESDMVIVSDSVCCTIDGHDTETVLGLIWVREKVRGERKSYLFMLGYCTECQKYYMDEDDYKTVYKIGRPEVSLSRVVSNDSYMITSGEVFDLENKHLNMLEKEIAEEISSIHNQPDYVSQYATISGYDDGNLAYSKSQSKKKYEFRLDELDGYKNCPYQYRVDVSVGMSTKKYYIGSVDIKLNNMTSVISANSGFGRKLVHYRTTEVAINGQRYKIKLSRQFDIDNAMLYGYANLRTDEDAIFRKGITDPILVQVLKIRKQQHSLIDIFATIQENQNNIVDVDINRNLIVQGCAGSGKTMVMLHRLSSLKYNHPEFDFSRNALILTPNDHFTLYIKGLAESLQIGSIMRMSVEQYYAYVLSEYSKEMKPVGSISSEMSVNQMLVDFVYSDEFRSLFEEKYNGVINIRNQLIGQVQNVALLMNETCKEVDVSDDSKVVPQLNSIVSLLASKISRSEKRISDAAKSLEDIQERKAALGEEIPKKRQLASIELKKSAIRAKAKALSTLVTLQKTIEKKRKEKENASQDGMHEALQNTMPATQTVHSANDMQVDTNKLNEWLDVIDQLNDEMTDADIAAWMEVLSEFAPNVNDELKLYRRFKEDTVKSESKYIEMDTEVEEAQKMYDKEVSGRYSAEAQDGVAQLTNVLLQYSDLGTFQMIFDATIAPFMEKHNIKNIVGRYHRYDLYAQLVFARRFYGRNVTIPVKFMCVDEGQDLAFNEYRLIRALNSNITTFNIFGDTNQLIKTNRGISDWEVLEKLFMADRFILNENYRNTNQITRFCNDSFEMSMLQTGVDGVKVREITKKEFDAEVSAIKISTERIAVLLPRGVSKRKYINVIPTATDAEGGEIAKEKIAVMYVDEVKGIEFNKVYVVPNNMSRNEKYIAYTRALNELIVVIDETAFA